MNSYFLDLHVHIGRSGDGKPVKITASRSLTLPNILREATERKGLDIVGIVDCASPGVIADLDELQRNGNLTEMAAGGFRYGDRLTLIAGVELETREESGRGAHCLCFFPSLARLHDFAGFVAERVKNAQLSTQVCYLTARQLLEAVTAMGGLFIPAHVFTPHKSLFGSCAATLQEIFGAQAGLIKAVELGLSSDSKMALYLPELRKMTFLANSDAHSLEKMGREYNRVELAAPTFQELVLMLSREQGRRVTANYGLDPKLGKYHRSYCNICGQPALGSIPVLTCPVCGKNDDFVVGVLDRIISIGSGQDAPEPSYPYIYQVPLPFLPGLGPKTIGKLLSRFGTEMNVLHKAGPEELAEVVGTQLAQVILKARKGDLAITPGAGGSMAGFSTNSPQQESMLTVAYNMSGAVEAVRQGRFVILVDVIDMSTTLEAVMEAGVIACFGACPSGKRTPCPTNPYLIGRAAAREARAQGATVAIIAEPRTGTDHARSVKAEQVISGLSAEGCDEYELWPNLGAETAALTCWQKKVAIAVTESGGAVYDAVWQAGGRLTTATVARTLKMKGREPALAGPARARLLAHGCPLTLVAASSNALEDVLAVHFLAELLLTREVD